MFLEILAKTNHTFSICHKGGEVSISEWVGLVPWSIEWCPEMSVFVVYAEAVSRLRAATYRAGCQPGKMSHCSSLTEALTLNSAIFYCLRMYCCYNDLLLKLHYIFMYRGSWAHSL